MKTRLWKRLRRQAKKKYRLTVVMGRWSSADKLRYDIITESQTKGISTLDCYFSLEEAIPALEEYRNNYIRKLCDEIRTKRIVSTELKKIQNL